MYEPRAKYRGRWNKMHWVQLFEFLDTLLCSFANLVKSMVACACVSLYIFFLGGGTSVLNHTMIFAHCWISRNGIRHVSQKTKQVLYHNDRPDGIAILRVKLQSWISRQDHQSRSRVLKILSRGPVSFPCLQLAFTLFCLQLAFTPVYFKVSFHFDLLPIGLHFELLRDPGSGSWLEILTRDPNSQSDWQSYLVIVTFSFAQTLKISRRKDISLPRNANVLWSLSTWDRSVTTIW